MRLSKRTLSSKSKRPIQALQSAINLRPISPNRLRMCSSQNGRARSRQHPMARASKCSRQPICGDQIRLWNGPRPFQAKSAASSAAAIWTDYYQVNLQRSSPIVAAHRPCRPLRMAIPSPMSSLPRRRLPASSMSLCQRIQPIPMRPAC